jgi:type II secretion system protein N
MNLAFGRLLSFSDRLAGNRRLFLLCLLLFLFSFWVALWVAFPADVLQRRLVSEVTKQTGVRMQGHNASLLFPIGLEFDLRVFPDMPALAPIDLQQLQVSPAWARLFSGAPQIDLQGSLSDGSLDARVGRNGALQARLRGVDIAPLQTASQGYRVEGRLSGDFSGEQLSAAMTGEGEFVLQLRETRLLGLERLGLPENLALGLLSLEGRFKERRLSIEKALLTEGALEMSGGGTLLVGETPEQTRLNLNVRLHPTASTPPGLRDLLDLTGVKPTADGSFLLRIGGTLARPAIR